MTEPFTRGVFGQDEALIGWACDKIGYVKATRFAGCHAIGVVDGRGQLGAAAIYGPDDDFKDCEISFALQPGFYLSRAAISMFLRYPFGQLKYVRVTAVTPHKATSTRQFLEKLGFKREGVLRRRFGTDDAVVYGLLAKEWARSVFNIERRTDVPPLRVRKNLGHGQEGRQHAGPSAGSGADG